MILFKELDLPPIPSDLIVFKDRPDKFVKDIGYGLEHFKNGRRLEACSYSGTICTNQETIHWIEKNISKFVFRVFKQTSEPVGQEGTHIVHSDITRVFALNYFLETGGTDVITSWYHENGFPLRRTKSFGGKQSDTAGQVKYDNLTTLGSTKFKTFTWYLMAVDILHDVDHITSTRTSISLSFSDNRVLEELEIQDI